MLLAWVSTLKEWQATKQSALYKQALFSFVFFPFCYNSSTVFTCVRICDCKWNHVKGIESFCLTWIWGIWSATLQIFVNLLDIQGLWSLNLLDIRSLWSTNHLYIYEYQLNSGEGLQITKHIQFSWKSWISWIILNLLDIQVPWKHLYISENLWPMRRKSQGYLGPLTH